MPKNPLHKLLNPQSIAYFGGSNSITTMGTAQLISIIQGGFQGKIYPVHPREKTVLGLKAYPKVDALPETPDLAVLVIPGKALPQVLAECGKKGVRRAIVTTAGFGEMGDQGKAHQQELLEVARRWRIRLMGPNCLGVVNTHRRLNTTWFHYSGQAGGVGLISQSGSYVTQTLPYFNKIGLGVSKAMSVGNQADLDMVDCLDYLGEDPETRVIGLYIEGLKRPRAFLEAAGRVTPHKPIVALYVGGNEAGSRAGSSHTGAVAGPDHLFDALARQAGILKAYSIAELFDWCLALASQPLPAGNKVVILTNSGGPGTSMANECERRGLSVPMFDRQTRDEIAALSPLTASGRNPVDVTMNYDMDLIYRKLPKLILPRPEIDGMLFYGMFGPEIFTEKIQAAANLSGGESLFPPQAMEQMLHQACKEFTSYPKRFGKPLVGASFFGREDLAVRLLQDGGVPVYPSPERAVRAMSALWRYAQIRMERQCNG